MAGLRRGVAGGRPAERASPYAPYEYASSDGIPRRFTVRFPSLDGVLQNA